MTHRIVDSPIGPITLVVDADGALTYVLTDGQAHHPGEAALGARDDAAAPDAAAQFAEYFTGTRTSFDLRLAPRGTDFQQRVWTELARIPFGETSTYGGVAARLGSPQSARAVGMATGRNPLSIMVPCHRLVGAGGALTGYAGGVERKRWLLDHERRVAKN